MSLALDRCGWTMAGPVGRGAPVAAAAVGVDLVVLAVPDSVVREVAEAIDPNPAAVIIHLAGSLGLDVLAGHDRVGALHPLVALPDARIGADRLLSGQWFGVAGDPITVELVGQFGGSSFPVADADRATYHAAAAVASNHLVALLGQVERLAAAASVPFEAYLELVRGSVDNVAELGPRRALTGPVARGDEATVDRHRRALDPSELALYDQLVLAARRLLSD